MRPLRILDLYCGAGLVAEGLYEAGWETVGVDLTPQPRYPGPFIRHDALTLDMRFIRSFDAIWASPPCLRDTAMKHAPGARGAAHPELIPPTRRLLQASGLPYVLENVETAALIDPIILCGSHFGLGVYHDGRRFRLERHRKFETNWPLDAPPPCKHVGPVVGVYGSHARIRSAAAGGRKTSEPWGRPHREVMAEAMGCRSELTCKEISQGIPPVYARFIGLRLAAHVDAYRRAA